MSSIFCRHSITVRDRARTSPSSLASIGPCILRGQVRGKKGARSCCSGGLIPQILGPASRRRVLPTVPGIDKGTAHSAHPPCKAVSALSGEKVDTGCVPPGRARLATRPSQTGSCTSRKRDCLRTILAAIFCFLRLNTGNAVCRPTGQGDRARAGGILDSRRDALDPCRDRGAHCWVCRRARTPIRGAARELGRCRTAGRVSTPVSFSERSIRSALTSRPPSSRR